VDSLNHDLSVSLRIGDSVFGSTLAERGLSWAANIQDQSIDQYSGLAAIREAAIEYEQSVKTP